MALDPRRQLRRPDRRRRRDGGGAAGDRARALEPDVASLLGAIARSDLDEARAAMAQLRWRADHVAADREDPRRRDERLLPRDVRRELHADRAARRGRAAAGSSSTPTTEHLQPRRPGLARRAGSPAASAGRRSSSTSPCRRRRTRPPTTPRSSCRRSCGWTRGSSTCAPTSCSRPTSSAPSTARRCTPRGSRSTPSRCSSPRSCPSAPTSPTLAFATSAVTVAAAAARRGLRRPRHADRRLLGRAAARRLGAVRDGRRPQRRAPARARDLRRAALAAVDRRDRGAGGRRQRRLRGDATACATSSGTPPAA